MDTRTARIVWENREGPASVARALGRRTEPDAAPGRAVELLPGTARRDEYVSGVIVRVLADGALRVRLGFRRDLITVHPGEYRVQFTAEEVQGSFVAHFREVALAEMALLLGDPDEIPASLFSPVACPYQERHDVEVLERLEAYAATFDRDPAPVEAPQASGPVVVVPCSGIKRNRPAPARDLYLGSLYAAAMAAADAMIERGEAARVLILSARHGLVDPATVLEPYETRIDAPEAITTDALAQQLDTFAVTDAVLLTPGAYSRAFLAAAERRGIRAVTPLAGARGIGYMRARLATIRRGDAAPAPAPAMSWDDDVEPALIPDPLRRTAQPVLF